MADFDYDNENPAPISLSKMAIGSVDTLRGTALDQRIPETWNDQPPLLSYHTNTRPRSTRGQTVTEDSALLKAVVRRGIPPALRCAVWLSNVIQAVHPHLTDKYWHEYRTLAKVRALDNAYEQLLQTIVSGSYNNNNDSKDHAQQHAQQDGSNHSDTAAVWADMTVSTYGRSANATDVPGITEQGHMAVKRVLIGLEHVMGMDYAPMIPVLTQLLLTAMSESYAFCAVREMAHQATYYFPCSVTEQEAWCRAFGDVTRKLHPQTAVYLEDRGVLDSVHGAGLNPIFQEMFVGILPMECCLRILDIYTLEGCKVLFRFGVALLVLYKMESAEQLITISNADEWWNSMRLWTHSDRFSFEGLVRKAYGVHGRGIRRQLRFPRRSILTRIIKMEEERLLQAIADSGDNDGMYSSGPPPRPLGLCKASLHSVSEIVDTVETIEPVLAHSNQARLLLAEWMPVTMRLTNLDLLYSTNHHGRTLEMFYKSVKHAKHTVLLCEVLQGDKDVAEKKEPVVIGMYASQAWAASTRVYGDGECFLFRLQPSAQCWKWKPRPTGSTGSLFDSIDLEEMEQQSNNNQTALLEQFMVGTRNYISMGGNPDGSCGLRFNEDFTRGESSPAVGFENEPLHGTGCGSVFEVGLVEVYGLVRQMDGRAV